MNNRSDLIEQWTFLSCPHFCKTRNQDTFANEVVSLHFYTDWPIPDTAIIRNKPADPINVKMSEKAPIHFPSPLCKRIAIIAVIPAKMMIVNRVLVENIKLFPPIPLITDIKMMTPKILNKRDSQLIHVSLSKLSPPMNFW